MIMETINNVSIVKLNNMGSLCCKKLQIEQKVTTKSDSEDKTIKDVTVNDPNLGLHTT